MTFTENYRKIAAFMIFALLLLANYLAAITHPQFDIDMIGHILMKGKILADSSYASAVYFHDPVFATAHGNYPPLTALLHAFMVRLGLGGTAPYQALNYLVIFLTAIALYGSLARRIGKGQSLAWCFIFISTTEYLRDQFLMSSTDIFLSLFIFLTAQTFLDKKRDLFGVLCACSLLIKNDAVVFVGLITLGLWISDRRLPLRHLIILALLTGPWMIYRTTLPDPATGAEHMLKGFFAYLLPSDLPLLAATVTHVVTKNLYLLFLFLPLVWVLFIRKKDLHILTGCVLLTAGAYIIIIWGMIPLGIRHETPGLMRLFTHVYPVALFLTAMGLNKRV